MVLMLKVIKAVVVRCALLLHLTMTVWRVTVDLKNDMYWLIFLATLPFAIESLYTIIKRKGDDFLLFTPCFFFYLLATIPCVWLLELRKTDVYLSGKTDLLFNKTAEADSPLALEINPNTWTILIEELLLYLLIIGRWILPRGRITREQLSELLFAFIGTASDIMEMFSLFGEDQVRSNRILSYCILAVWSVAVTQFCMTLTVTHKPRRGKNIRVIDDNETEEKKRAAISHELIAIFLSMAMQDVPFVSVRLYTIIKYNLITYSLVFFTSKNCIVILLLFYKVAVLMQKRYCPERVKEKIYDEDDPKNMPYIVRDANSTKRNFQLQRPDDNETGSDSTGGSKEKAKLEKLYEENEKDSGKSSSKPTKAKKSKENKKKGEDHPLTPLANNNTPNGSPIHEKTPLTTVPNSPGHQPSQSSTSTPNSKTNQRSPTTTTSSAETPKTTPPKAGATGIPPRQDSSTPKLLTNRPRQSSTQTPKNTPKSSGDGAPPSGQVNPPQPPAPKGDPPIASGFGWISSQSPQEKDEVIVAGLT